ELLEAWGPQLSVLSHGRSSSRVQRTFIDETRILLLSEDTQRTEALARDLKSRGATVMVGDPTLGLERARQLEPEVVILDSAAVEGPCFELVRAARRDLRLRWASLLVASFRELFPSGEAPQIDPLVGQIYGLTGNDRGVQ